MTTVVDQSVNHHRLQCLLIREGVKKQLFLGLFPKHKFMITNLKGNKSPGLLCSLRKHVQQRGAAEVLTTNY